MVVGAKMTIQQAPSRGRKSILRLQQYTVQRRHSVIRLVYGALLIVIGFVMVLVDPLVTVTDWYMDMKEGSFIWKMYEKPSYQLFSEVYVFNYTNVPDYMAGRAKKLKLQEVGPFKFQETRTNENMTIDRERGVLTIHPKVTLKFLPEQSVAHYKDVQVYVPNIALTALSTLAADHLGYLANAGAYYSMSALGSQLFRNLSAEELLWGYHDPVVTIANKLLPGWIDFGKIGVLDRFYAERKDYAEIELKIPNRKFSINSWNGSPGLEEQGYTDLNSSIPCNRIQGSYEGLMVSPGLQKDFTIPIFRRQACRMYPFAFTEEIDGKFGFNYYRFALTKDSFNKTSDYACPCTKNCLPDGFVDISSCYYGFPIALSKPHFLDTDPEQAAFYEGMKPDPDRHGSYLDIEPTLGVPVSLFTKLQVNIAVRSNPGNPITGPLKDKIVPLLWIALYCEEPTTQIVNILRLRFVIAPPLIITIEVLLFLIGVFISVQGFHRLWKPKYKLISYSDDRENNNDKSLEKTPSNIILNVSDNVGFDDEFDLSRQAVSLLSIADDDIDDVLLNEDQVY